MDEIQEFTAELEDLTTDELKRKTAMLQIENEHLHRELARKNAAAIQEIREIVVLIGAKLGVITVVRDASSK